MPTEPTEHENYDDLDLESVQRLSRDMAEASITLSDAEARFLVDAYYMLQTRRVAANNQVIALSKSEEPHRVLAWQLEQMDTLERQTRRALVRWVDSPEQQPLGEWAQSIVGIGPVITAGLMAHIDIERADSVGKLWRFAGLDPTVRWEKKTKRPWNASLKTLCFKIGESFVKQQARPNDTYGQIYVARKALEIERNERGDFAEQAAQVLATKKIGKDTEAYKAYSVGKLPPAHIYARSKRYAVKLFLSAYHEAAYFSRYHKLPPMPYILTQPQHTHYRRPPNMHLIPGWQEARAAVDNAANDEDAA